MLLPSKVTPYNVSILAPMVAVASVLKSRSLTVSSLLSMPTIRQMDVHVMFLCLDAMFTLGKINLNPQTGELYYVD